MNMLNLAFCSPPAEPLPGSYGSVKDLAFWCNFRKWQEQEVCKAPIVFNLRGIAAFFPEELQQKGAENSSLQRHGWPLKNKV